VCFQEGGRISNEYKEITYVEFYFSRFSRWIPDLKFHLLTLLADRLLRSFPLPVTISLAAYTFTRLFKGGKEVKIYNEVVFSPAIWFCFRFILFSVIYFLVIFQLGSYHNFPLLNSLNVLSTIIEKELQTIVRSYISSSLIAAFYISWNCSCWCL